MQERLARLARLNSTDTSTGTSTRASNRAGAGVEQQKIVDRALGARKRDRPFLATSVARNHLTLLAGHLDANKPLLGLVVLLSFLLNAFSRLIHNFRARNYR